MSYIYKSSGKERVIFELSQNDRYIVELIQGDNGKQLVRKRLIDLEQKEQFVKKAMMMFNVSQAEGDNVGFAKILFIDTTEYYYIMEYISGPILSKIIDQIDIIKDSADLDALEVELCKIIGKLSLYGTYNLTPSLDQFLLDSDGELIWYNYCDAPKENQETIQNISAQEIAHRIIEDIKQPKLEVLRIEQEKKRIENEQQEQQQRKLQEQKEQELIRESEAKKKRNKSYIIAAAILIPIVIILYILLATPFLNHTKAKYAYDEVIPLNENFYLSLKGENFGLLDKEYKMLLDAEYQSIAPLDSSSLFIKKDGKFGVITDGILKLEPIYDNISQLTTKDISVKKDNKWGLFSSSFSEIYPVKYDSLAVFNNGYTILQLNNQFGLSYNGKELCQVAYDNIEATEDSFTVYRGAKYIVYSTISQRFIYKDSEYIPYKEGRKYGFKNPVGDILINAEYTTVSRFNHNMAKVSKEVERVAKYGLINQNGEVVIPISCNEISEYNSEFLIARVDEGFAAYKVADGSQVTTLYDKIIIRDEGFTIYKKNISMNTDKKGRFVYRPSDLIPYKFNIKASNDPWGYVDLFGNTVIEPKYCKAEYFSKSGYADVEVWGWFWNDSYTINMRGEKR
ncbi:MAG: WG repeat-containing protein [Rikenellaceae bacterium]